MKVTFLGTGTSQGVPVIGCNCEVCTSLDFRDQRLRASIHIEVDDLSVVVDTGPDFRQQMLKERIVKLDAILYTHEHKDHTAGLDDVRAYNYMQKCDMPIYARNQVIEQLRQEYAYIFSENKYPGIPQVQVNELVNQKFTIGNVEITPIEVMHYKLPVFGFRIHDFSYITDAKHISDIEKEKLKGTKVLVVNALQKDPHLSHFTLEEALEFIKEIQPEKAYLTHISHRLGKHSHVSATLPENVVIAHDGLTITI